MQILREGAIMRTKGMTVGDVKQWATKVLHDDLEAIINAKSSYSLPYYILITMKPGYDGPAAFGNSNELLHGEDTRRRPERKATKTVDMSKQRVMTHRMILMNTPPAVPLVGSSLVYINNKTGQVRFMYILPPDMPMIAGFDVELESETVAQDSIGMPIVFGRAN